MKIINWSAVALTLLLGRPCPAHGQSSMSAGLQGVTRVTCTFTAAAAGTWDDTGVARAAAKEAAVSISYDAIDTDGGTARINTRHGELAIIARASTWSLHLLQMGPEGTMGLTTVFNRENTPGKFKGVHTVHEFTPVGLPNFASRPEQHYGECEVER